MSVVQVKICGLTNLDDALDAIEFGADALGFNFYPDSRRYISPEKTLEILGEIPDNILTVGVFVNAHPQFVIDLAIALELDLLQFHGDESPEYCAQFARPWYKAFRPKDEEALGEIERYEGECLLIDSFSEKIYGGSGVVTNWDLATKAKRYGKVILAGGLTPDNVAMAIHSVKPFAVDVASGVETAPRKKDRAKLEEFVNRAKGVEI